MLVQLPNLAFLLLGGVFVWAGTEHFLRFHTVAALLAQRGLPAPAAMLATGSAVELIAGACLMLDILRPYAALVLIVFTALASVLLLDFWRLSGKDRQAARSAFLINIAVIGGLMLAVAYPV